MKKWSVIVAVLLTVLCLPVCNADSAFDPAAVAVDDTVTFGHYEQDNDLNNGPELIEWIVLDVQDGKALLLSKYGLDAKPYNTELLSTKWEICTLRAWLNDDFIDAAFSVNEKSAILLTDVDNSVSQGYDWTLAGFSESPSGGKNTQDQIFLLSYKEANQYLNVEHWTVDDAGKNIKSRVAPTAYALAQGAYDYYHQTTDNTNAGWWWLRSPGAIRKRAAFIDEDGSLNHNYVDLSTGCVRPALWIDLNSGIF